MSTPPAETVLVTGGASGIGLATVRLLIAEGRHVVSCDRDKTLLDQSVAPFAAVGERLRTVVFDVADENGVVAAIAKASADFGPIIGLVNCAGFGKDVPALETSADLFRTMLDVNLVGSFVVARETARHMRTHGHGSIVNLSSVSSFAGVQGRVAYGATKAGVNIMTQVMAVEFAPFGIRVNAIAPGPIDTPLTLQMHSDAVRQRWRSAVPQARYGTPEEVASVAAFLLDSSKSGFVTGQIIGVDGGFIAAGFRGGSPANSP